MSQRVRELRDALRELEGASRQLAEAIKGFNELQKVKPFPNHYTPDSVDELLQHHELATEDNGCAVLIRDWPDALVFCERSRVRWYTAVDAVTPLIDAAAGLMDDSSQPAGLRWTTLLRAAVLSLVSCYSDWYQGKSRRIAFSEPVRPDFVTAIGSIRGGHQELSAALMSRSKTKTSLPKSVDDESHLSPSKLAELFHLPLEALRSRLRRWRQKNLSGWIENSERGPKEAQYLYRFGSVRRIIEDIQATSETTSERPAKKK